jgi:hypothetical protein
VFSNLTNNQQGDPSDIGDLLNIGQSSASPTDYG